MHGKSSLADGKNHQNPHTSKHLFVLKTSSLNIERDVNKKKTLKQTADGRRKTQTVDGRRKTQTADRRRKTQTADRRRRTQTADGCAGRKPQARCAGTRQSERPSTT